MLGYKDFNSYENSIIETLIESFNYSMVEAKSVVNGYRTVMNRIGLFDNPNEWAFKLDEAMRYHITPDMWLNIL